jgi:hypothetical protein
MKQCGNDTQIVKEEEKSPLAEKVMMGRSDSLLKYRLKHNNHSTAEDSKIPENMIYTPL